MLLGDAAERVILVLLQRVATQPQIDLVRQTASRVIANMNPAGWAVIVVDIPPALPSDLAALLHTDDATVDAVFLSPGTGLARNARTYRLGDITAALEIQTAFAEAGS
jgi:hypothetical protein